MARPAHVAIALALLLASCRTVYDERAEQNVAATRGAYYGCLGKAADILDVSGEPAETIFLAARDQCAAERESHGAAVALVAGVPASSYQVADLSDRDAQGFVVNRILKRRALRAVR